MGTFIVVLVVLLIGGGVLAGVMGFSLFAVTESQRKTASAGAPQALDALFSTGAVTVTYDSRPASSLEAITVAQGAMQRGYRLVHNNGGQLLFERTQASASAADMSTK